MKSKEYYPPEKCNNGGYTFFLEINFYSMVNIFTTCKRIAGVKAKMNKHVWCCIPYFFSKSFDLGHSNRKKFSRAIKVS